MPHPGDMRWRRQGLGPDDERCGGIPVDEPHDCDRRLPEGCASRESGERCRLATVPDRSEHLAGQYLLGRVHLPVRPVARSQRSLRRHLRPVLHETSPDGGSAAAHGGNHLSAVGIPNHRWTGAGRRDADLDRQQNSRRYRIFSRHSEPSMDGRWKTGR